MLSSVSFVWRSLAAVILPGTPSHWRARRRYKPQRPPHSQHKACGKVRRCFPFAHVFELLMDVHTPLPPSLLFLAQFGGAGANWLYAQTGNVGPSWLDWTWRYHCVLERTRPLAHPSSRTTRRTAHHSHTPAAATAAVVQ